MILPVLACIAAMICAGCSGGDAGGNNVTYPDIGTPNATIPAEGGDSPRLLWGIWNLTFDLTEMRIIPLPDREAAAHWNVTPMLMPPNCSDCVSIQVLEFKPAQKYVKLKIALKNPSGLTGYDVRGIAVVPTREVRLINSDGWTALWDDGGEVTRNPFKAFATDWPERQIEPGTAHARIYEFTFSSFLQLTLGTKLVVDASWPGHCQEAYAFNGVHQNGYINGDTSTADFSVSLTPQDWQGNISTVLIDLSEIGGGIEPMMQSGNDWQYSFSGPVVVPATSRANIWAEVVDKATVVRAYWLFEIGVVNENPGLQEITGINAGPGGLYVDLTWDEIDDPNVAGVNIYRRTKGGSYNFGSPVNPTLVSGVKFRDSNVTRNVMYFYVLRAVGFDNSLGPVSTEVGAKPFEWADQFMLSDYDLNDSLYPNVAVGADGLSRVVWYDDRTADTPYFDIIEENFTPDIRLYSEDMDHDKAFFPNIVTDGQKFALYADCYVSSIADTDIIVHRFADETSLEPEFVSFGTYIPQTNSKNACFDLDGNLWIAYGDSPVPSPGPYHVYVRSISPGMHVSEPIKLSPEEHNAAHVAGIVCDNSGELHCAFAVAGDIGQLYYARTIAGVWQPAEQVSQFPSEAAIRKERLDVDSEGRAYVIYASGSFVPEYPFISLQRRDPAGWSKHYDIFPDVVGCTGLAIVIDDDNNINVFHCPGADQQEIKFRRGYNGSWSEIYDVTSGFIPGYPTTFTHLFSADCSSSGAIALVWEQGGIFIYARRMIQ